MPYYRTPLKTLAIDLTLNPTIPLIFLYDRNHIYRQIIDENFYTFLLHADTSLELLETGDFMINALNGVQDVCAAVEEYYGSGTCPKCNGLSLLVTYTASSTRNLKGSIETTPDEEIITACAGRTSLETFINSDSEFLSDEISANNETEVL